MKREKLIKQIKQLEKDNLELKNEIKIEKESKANLETQITELIEQSAKNNEHTLKLEEEIEKFKNEKDTLLTESVYFVQEVNLYKSQNAQLEATIKNYEEEALKSKVSIEKERENMILEKMDTIKELQTKLTQNEIIIEQLQTEKEEMNAKITVLQDESESKDAVINSLQKKIQSLVEETKRLSNSKLIDLESSPMMKSAFSPQSFGSRILNEVESIEDNESPLKIKLESLKDIVKTPQKYEEEIKNLKQLNESLSNSIEKMKVSRESPTKKNFTLLGNPTKETAEYLQKLVVTLTEAIAEKDLSLENQKNLNKELGKKISELEQQLKFKETIN